MNQITLKPASEGLLVPLPRPVNGQKYLSPEGQPVELTAYWRRRIQAGEVTICKVEE